MPAPTQTKEQPKQWSGTTSGELVKPDGEQPPIEAKPGAPKPDAPPAPAPEGEPPETSEPFDERKYPWLPDRLKRERSRGATEARAQLLRELEINDLDKWRSEQKERTDKLTRFQEMEERRKRLQMSEADRYRTDFQKAQDQIKQLESKIVDMEETSMSDKQEQSIKTQALKFIDPEMYDYARGEFVAHVNSLIESDPNALDTYDEEKIAEFFSGLASRKPKLALAQPEPEKKEPEEKPVIKKPITTGAGPKAPIPGASREERTPDQVGDKTVLPGRPNSMTRRELNQHLRAQGKRPW